MARGVRFTKAEREWLRSWLPANVAAEEGSKRAKLGEAVLAKLLASEEAPATVDVAPIEEALVAFARGKVIALEGGFPRARVQATACKATVEDAKLVGGWMARQGWLTGPMTLLDVLNKWHMWLPKARATQPPPALQPGLGTDAVQGPGTAQGEQPSVAGSQPGRRPAGGRTVPGFR